MVTNDSVRVREKPGLHGHSMLMLHKGHLVIKIEEQGEWTRIYFKGREAQTDKTEGWMHSSFLQPENKFFQQNTSSFIALNHHAAKLVCEQVIGTELIRGCKLNLRYSLEQKAGLRYFTVACNAELVTKNRVGKLIPVPVSQSQEYKVADFGVEYSMDILMKASAAYELVEVNLVGHRCQVVGYKT